MSQAACRQQNNQEKADVRPGCGLGALDTRRGEPHLLPQAGGTTEGFSQQGLCSVLLCSLG